MITVVQGDITRQKGVDVIVNAARPSLLGGGGVDGAIHRAAGPKLFAACSALQERPEGEITEATRRILARERALEYTPCDVRCNVGDAVLTPGFNLVQHIVHTVGPIYDPSIDEECEANLMDAYVSSLTLAHLQLGRTVALPAISAGVYGYPLDKVAEIALTAASCRYWNFDEIRFVLFPDDVFKAFNDALSRRTTPE